VIDPAAFDTALFWLFAAVAVAAALVVTLQRSPLYSAFGLIVTLCALSVIYGLLGSPFIAVLQIVVYAGAIMVLFLFVIMLLNVKREDHEGGQAAFKGTAAALAVLLALQVGRVLVRTGPRPPVPDFDASTHKMAEILFSPYFLYVFEATSILLLAALVGAVALARKEP
jgi:NADH-quinone oxidoreductase subunit J